MMYTFGDLEIYEILLSLSRQFAIDPSCTIESEAYFRTLVANYSGSDNLSDFRAWLGEVVVRDFRYLTSLPRWIQSSEWQFHEGKPMIFVGEIKIPISANSIFHDKTVFYLFYLKGITKVGLQQF